MLFILAGGSLAAAFIAQYVFDMQPCILCIYQRYPYAIIAGLAVLAMMVPDRYNVAKALLVLCCMIFLVEAGIAVFHIGVEQKWWSGTDECGGEGFAGTIEEIRAAIFNAPIKRCDEREVFFLGLSMADWNALWALFLAGLCLITFNRIGKNATR